MKYLIDTCVISELAKAAPNEKVAFWAAQSDEEEFYLSSLTFGEIHQGISKLLPSKRRERLDQWVECDPKEKREKPVKSKYS